MNDRCRNLIISMTVGGLFIAGLLLLLVPTTSTHAWPVTPMPSPTPPATRPPGPAFVRPGGSGSWCLQDDPCGSIQYAIDRCEPGNGDTIYVAGGVYTGSGTAVITVTKSVTLYGGWDGATGGPVVRDPDLCPTTLDGERQRRVIMITGTVTPTIDGFIIARGNATGLGGGPFDSDAGGGIYSYGAAPIIHDNVITNNIASRQAGARAMGGGIYIRLKSGSAIIRGNHIVSNTAGVNIGQGEGGGAFLCGSAQVQDNRFEKNVACLGCSFAYGGGMCVGWTSQGVEIADNAFVDNRASEGGGIHLFWSAAQIAGNDIYDNNAKWGGGMYLYYDVGSVVESNEVISNAASVIGGGVVIRITPTSARPQILNNFIARNGATGDGGGVYAWSDWHISSITFTHNTLVNNGTGVVAGTNMTVTMVNNILVSHTVGITLAGSSGNVFADHSLFWANDDDGTRGTNAVDGDPAFVDPASDDYHLGSGSAAIDAGVDAGVASDIDGDPRPAGTGYDIGADEFAVHVYLPLIVREHQ